MKHIEDAEKVMNSIKETSDVLSNITTVVGLFLFVVIVFALSLYRYV